MKDFPEAMILEGIKIEDFQRMLHCLAISDHPQYQVAAAAHPLTKEETLLYLASRATYWGTYGMGPLNEISERKDLSDEVMLALMDNEHYPNEMFLDGKMLSVVVAVRLIEIEKSLHDSIARSDKIPKEALRLLAEKAHFSDVQTLAGYSPFFDEELLEIILKRPDIDERRLDCSRETRRHWVYLALATNKNIVMPEKLQLRIIEDGKIFPGKAVFNRLSWRNDLTEKTLSVLADLKVKVKVEA